MVIGEGGTDQTPFMFQIFQHFESDFCEQIAV